MSTPDAPLARAVHGLIAGSVATHEAVAERLGINSTDLRCLVLASTEPGLQPTRLAELAGLTTGAITGVLDRLERAGFVRREPDPADRRRLRVQLVADRVDEIEGYYEPLFERAQQLTATWEPTAREHVAEYVEAFAATLREEAARLRVAARGGLVGNMYTAPLGEVERARLVFASGAPRLAFGGAALGQQVRVVAETAATRLRLRGRGGRRAARAGRVQRSRTGCPHLERRGHDALRSTPDRRAQPARRRRAERPPGVVDRGRRWRHRPRRRPAHRPSRVARDARRGQPHPAEPGAARGHCAHRAGRRDERCPHRAARAAWHWPSRSATGSRICASTETGPSSVSGALRLQTDGYGAATERFEIELRGGASGVTIEAV